MAPAQLNGHKADQLNDTYALGILVFESATKRKIHNVRILLKNFSQKETTNFLIKLVPKSFEKTIPILISSCVQKPKRRATALQVNIRVY